MNVGVRGQLQSVVFDILSATGRAMTAAELRAGLVEAGISGAHAEPIYRSLGSLRRCGAVERVRHPGQTRTHWAVADSAALRLATSRAAESSDREGVVDVF